MAAAKDGMYEAIVGKRALRIRKSALHSRKNKKELCIFEHTICCCSHEGNPAIFARELGPKEPCKSAKALYIFAQIKTIALRFLKRKKMLSSFARM